MTKTVLARVISAAIALTCTREAWAAEAVKVGWCARTVTSAAAPFAIATKMGWYRDAGIKVELAPLPGSTDCVKLVSTGDLPYALASVEALPAVRAEGVKAQIFYTAYQGNIYGIAVPKDSPIHSVKDLAGKKIGVASMASGAVQVVRGVLAMDGLNPEKDAQIVVAGEAAQAAALLRSNQVQALALYDTQFALVENAGQPLRTLDTGPISRFPSNGFVALERTLHDRRAQAVALAKGYAMGTVFALANPEAAVKMVYEVFPQTRPAGKSEAQALHDDVKTLLARAQHWLLSDSGVHRWGESSLQEYGAYEDFLLRWGVIRVKVPPSELVTNDLVPEINTFDPAKVTAQAKAYK